MMCEQILTEVGRQAHEALESSFLRDTLDKTREPKNQESGAIRGKRFSEGRCA